MNREEIMGYIKRIEELELKLLEKKCSDKDVEYKEKIKLQNRIDKAIEYIRSEYTITDDDVYLALYSSNGTLDKLEKILEGEEND